MSQNNCPLCFGTGTIITENNTVKCDCQKITELSENFKRLSSKSQKQLFLFLDSLLKDDQKPTPQKSSKSSDFILPLRKIHDSFESLPEFQKHNLTAKQASYYAEALIWLVKEFSEFSWDSSRDISKDEVFQNLTFTLEVALGFLSVTQSSIDFMDISKEGKV